MLLEETRWAARCSELSMLGDAPGTPLGAPDRLLDGLELSMPLGDALGTPRGAPDVFCAPSSRERHMVLLDIQGVPHPAM